MKNRLRLLGILFAGAILFASCGGENTPEESSEAPTGSRTEAVVTEPGAPETLFELVRDGKALAKIVYPDEAGDSLRETVKSLQGAVKEKTGAVILATSAEESSGKTEAPELLIGSTGYAESTAEAAKLEGYLDYSVRISGNKLVFSGKNEDSVVRAVYWFINICIKDAANGAGSLTFSSNQNYLYRGKYPMENLKLFEKPFADYRIVVPADADITVRRFAEYYRAYLCSMTGTNLPIVADTEAETACEIRIGKTSRTQTTVAKYEYAVAVRGSAVELVADSLYGYEAAYPYAINGFLTAARGMKPQTAELARVDITDTLTDGTENILSRTGDVRVMFHNIWGWNESATNPTEQRNQMLAATYLEYLPDVLCLQECTMMMRNAAKHPIAQALLSAGYEELSQDAIDGKLTATPILYRTDKLTLKAKGQYKFPVGGGDDKFVTWGVFTENKTGGQTFAVVSVHLAYQQTAEGNAWRCSQVDEVAGIVSDLRRQYQCPVITGGDINCTPTSDPYQRFLEKGFTDVQGIAAKTESSATHFGYPSFSEMIGMFTRAAITNKGSYADGAYDHVFLTGGGVTFDLYDIVTDNYVMCASDHTPTLVEFSFRRQSVTPTPGESDGEAPGEYTWRY